MRDVVLIVAEEHERRAAEFCQRHQDFTTSESMDDLAAEFEKVARAARAQAMKDAASWCQNVVRGARPPGRADAEVCQEAAAQTGGGEAQEARQEETTMRVFRRAARLARSTLDTLRAFADGVLDDSYHRRSTDVFDDFETGFSVDWSRYPNLAALLDAERRHGLLDPELRALLADARADAVRFIRDARADELAQARASERARIATLTNNGVAGPDVIRAMSKADLLQALRNVGCDLTCEACASLFFKGGGFTTILHTCEAQRVR